MEKLSRHIPWNEITHIVQQNKDILIYYSDSRKESVEIEQYSFNSLLNFVKVNYNTIVSKNFINSILRIRRKIVLLIDKTEIVVSRRKSYYFK